MWTLHLLADKKRKRKKGKIDTSEEIEALSTVPRPRDATKSESEDHNQNITVDELHLNQDKSKSTVVIGKGKQKGKSKEEKQDNVDPWGWGFTNEEVMKWPALRKRNFWCIQRHSATALHYDLRMQLDGQTFSWAIPKGLLGMSKRAEAGRLAVETTLHPIDYTTYEGADGRVFSGGRRGGTLLWDIGTYRITRPGEDSGSESEVERRQQRVDRRKRRRISSKGRNGDDQNEGDDDEEGGGDGDDRHQEDMFRQALYRQLGYGKSRSMHFTLEGGAKMTNHSYILVLSPSQIITTHSPSTAEYGQSATITRTKKTWFLNLPRGVDAYPWDKDGEDGPFYGSSVKSDF